MSKHRIVKSDFWVDDYVEELPINERYFFLYLLTNPETNILGIYKTTIKRICFETDLERPNVENMFGRFSKDDKVHFIDNHILMVNFQKHQNPSGTMKTGIKKLINNLPKTVMDFILSKKSNIYYSLYRGYLIDYIYPYKDKDINKGKGKDKDKDKDKDKIESKSEPPEVSEYPKSFLKLMDDYPNTKGSPSQTFKNWKSCKKILSEDEIYSACMNSSKKQEANSKNSEVFYFQLSNLLSKRKYQSDLPDLVNWEPPQSNSKEITTADHYNTLPPVSEDGVVHFPKPVLSDEDLKAVF